MSPHQIELLLASVAELQVRLATAHQSVASLCRDIERMAIRRHGWLAEWNRLTAQQQFALGQIRKGYRRGVNVRTAESLERLGLIERIARGWQATYAGARLLEGRENGDSRPVAARTDPGRND